MMIKREAALPVRLLHLEDSHRDAELIREKLSAGGLECEILRVDGRQSFETSLDANQFDLILCDYNLPDYDGVSALSLARQKLPHVPVIILSGSVDDEEAVKCLHLGATDYLMKQRLERFVPAVRRALQDAVDRQKQRRAEEHLRESELRYREIVQRSPDLIALVQGGKIAFINDAGLRLLRLQSADKILGASPLDLFHADYQDSVAQRLSLLSEQPGTVPMVEEKLITAEGAALSVEGWAVSFHSDGELVIQVVCRDISERKRAEDKLRTSEEHFRQLAETLEDVFWVTGPGEERLIYVSPAYEQVWGRSVSDLHLHPVDWTEAIVPEDRQRVLDALRDLYCGRRYDLEYRIKRPDGSLRYIHDRGFAIRGEDGEVRRTVGVARDITERKESEAVFMQRTAELERFHRLSVGRELRMLELKKEVNDASVRAGLPAPYDLSFAANAIDHKASSHV